MHDPKSLHLCGSGQWTEHLFKNIFQTFRRKLTYPRLILGLIPTSTHPIKHWCKRTFVLCFVMIRWCGECCTDLRRRNGQTSPPPQKKKINLQMWCLLCTSFCQFWTVPYIFTDCCVFPEPFPTPHVPVIEKSHKL
jgi:hypothetical protein